MMTKGCHMVRVDDYNNNYAPPHPELEASASSSNSDPTILFSFGGKEAVETAMDTPRSRLPFLPEGYLLVIMVLSSSSSSLSNSSVTNEEAEVLGLGI